MKYLISLFVVILVGCNSNAAEQVLSYEQLKKFPVSCDKKDSQLQELKRIQKIKNFDPDLEKLSDADQLYNSRLKATIWWYAYSCEQN